MQRPVQTIILLLLSLLFYATAPAQLNLYAQLRTRTEYRDGQGSPLPKDARPALFTSQRTRLSASFSAYRVKLGLTVQDVRVWGQDASTINRTTTPDNNGFMLHEAWGQIAFTDTSNNKYQLAIKAGRQEIIYDDQRLFGNLDWLQQARRHDAAILQFTTSHWTIHTGFAFNQNKENPTGTQYNPIPAGSYAATTNGGTMYKILEYLYMNKKYMQANISFLFFGDQFSKYHTITDSIALVKVWEEGVWSRFTTGFFCNYNFTKIQLKAAAYYQFGKTASGQKLSAGLLSAIISYKINDKLSIGPGIDYTTGGSEADISNAFDPLYGTAHKFWGFMDYFYAGSLFGNKGLTAYYLKTKYRVSSAIHITADLHHFNSSSVVFEENGNKMSRHFGTEADIIANYSLTPMIGFEAGYCHFFSSPTLSSIRIKNIANAQNNNSWVYLMIKIQPSFKM